MCGVKWRRFIVLFKQSSIRWFVKMAGWSLACRQSVFQWYHSEKHLSEFYPQDGSESQLALKLRHCHPMYSETLPLRRRQDVVGWYTRHGVRPSSAGCTRFVLAAVRNRRAPRQAAARSDVSVNIDRGWPAAAADIASPHHDTRRSAVPRAPSTAAPTCSSATSPRFR